MNKFIMGMLLSMGFSLLSSEATITSKSQAFKNFSLIKELNSKVKGVKSISWSPDKTKIASISVDKTISIWNLDGLLAEHVIDTPEDKEIFSIAWSHDGERLAVGFEKDIVIYTLETDDAKVLSGHTKGVSSLSWSTDNTRLVSGSFDGTVRTWDVVTATQTSLHDNSDSGRVLCVSWSPDNKHIAFGSISDSIKILDAKNLEVSRTLTCDSSIIKSISWSPDSTKLAVGPRDGVIRIWDVKNNKITANWKAQNQVVTSISWSRYNLIASTSTDNTISIWDHQGKLLKELNDFNTHVICVKWSPSGKELAACSIDSPTIRIYGMKPSSCQAALSVSSTSLAAMPIKEESKSNLESVSLEMLQNVNSSSIPASNSLANYATPTNSKIEDQIINSIVTLTNEHCAIARSHPEIIIYDFENHGILLTLRGHSKNVTALAWSSKGRILASAAEDNAIIIWDNQGDILQTMAGHNNPIKSLSISPDGKYLISGSYNNEIFVWDIEEGQFLSSLENSGSLIYSVAYSPCGKKIAASTKNNIIMWDKETDFKIPTYLNAHNGAVFSISYSPNGEKLVSAGQDGKIRIWDTNSNNLLNELEGHKQDVYIVAWSPDGKKIASGSDDNTIKLWDAESGSLINAAKKHTDLVYSLAWSPDSKSLISGGNDKQIIVGKAGK
ncbi:MAG: WD40 repeat domain-containing protein [Candidatus Babeliales bacterium]|nr:WD40 repeat domain-containing protein [Candidatus Babeliales bacterium]